MKKNKIEQLIEEDKGYLITSKAVDAGILMMSGQMNCLFSRRETKILFIRGKLRCICMV